MMSPDLTTVLFYLLLVVVGGVIAFIGDAVGRWIAKKRWRIFGRRPRVTASIFAVLTGVVIAVSVFSILALTSEYVRTLATGLNRLKDEIQAKESLKTALTRDYNLQVREVKRLESEIERLKEGLSTSHSHLAETSGRLSDTSKKLSATEKDLKRESTLLSSAKTDLSSTKKEMEETKGRVSSLSQKRKSLEEDIEEKKIKIDYLEERRTQLEKERAEEEKRFHTVPILFRSGHPLAYVTAAKEEKMKRISTRLDEELSRLKFRLSKKNIRLLDPDPEKIESLLSDLSSYQADAVVIIKAARNIFQGDSVTIRFDITSNRVVFEEGHVIEEVEVGQNESVKDIREKLANAIKSVVAKAVKRGMLPTLEDDSLDVEMNIPYDTFNSYVNEIFQKKPVIFRLISKKEIRKTDTLDDISVEIKEPIG